MKPPSIVVLENKLGIVIKNVGFPQYDFRFEDYFCCKHPHQIDKPIKAVARMGSIPDYKKRFHMLKNWNIELLHTPVDYEKTSYLPVWYPLIKEFTPKSIWFDNIPTLADVLNVLEWPIFIKGERQTNKHNRHQSIIENEMQFNIVMAHWKKDPILWWQRVVCREYINLKTVARSSKTVFPKSYEFRTFWWRSSCVGIGRYWLSEHYDINPTDYNKIVEIGKEVTNCLDVIFVVLDFAKTMDGKWIVIECNDAQDSGYAGVNPMLMWHNVIQQIKE